MVPRSNYQKIFKVLRIIFLLFVIYVTLLTSLIELGILPRNPNFLSGNTEENQNNIEQDLFIIDSTSGGVEGVLLKPNYNLINDDFPKIITDLFSPTEKTYISAMYQGEEYPGEYVVENAEKIYKQYPWFDNPEIVAKNYGPLFGLGTSTMYMKGKSINGGESGFDWYEILATEDGVEYKITLQTVYSRIPPIWTIRSVTDTKKEKEELTKLRVTFVFMPYDESGEIKSGNPQVVWKESSKNTQNLVDINYPHINIHLNNQADPTTVNNQNILVLSKGAKLQGVKINYVEEEGSYDYRTFTMEQIKIDLSNVPNLEKLANSDIEIILTDKIKDLRGASLQQCRKTDKHLGDCIDDEEGNKKGAYGFLVWLYNSKDFLSN